MIWLALIVTFAGTLAHGSASSQTGVTRTFPTEVIDVDDNRIDVRKLASEKKLFVVTLKATWCPVCFNQLKRLNEIRDELKICGATFLVLSPGPKEQLQALRKRSGFPYPFVEDKELKITKSLNLKLTHNQIQPAIFAVDRNCKVKWMQYGRNGAYYGDKELQEYLSCDFEIAELLQ